MNLKGVVKKFGYYCAAFFMLVALSLVNACDKEPEYNAPIIGLSLNELNNNFRIAAAQNAINAITESGCGYTLKTSLDVEDQILRIDTIIASGCDALIIMPQSQELFGSDIIKRINQLRIPLICFGEKPETDDVEYAAFVSGDNASAGKSAATFIVDTLCNDITAVAKQILLLTAPSVAAWQKQIGAFKKEISKHPVVIVDECKLASYSREEAEEKLEMWVSSHPQLAEKIDAIYAQDDEIALGALDVIERMGLNNIKALVSCGASKAYLKRIKESTDDMAIASTYYLSEMIRQCVDIAIQIVLYGKQPEEKDNTATAAVVIDKNNVDEYYDDSLAYIIPE